ncbi:hypothetical protein NDN08_000437 [Rhodosorus marinus]|uniref:Maspardin n=1 Tax=Rhodosorus marinus TaxID=101924 RepID=A0AAV8UN06_9RHOD|nr:hypothetical protein NDN08_000437 [Rhodosorus marinus]
MGELAKGSEYANFRAWVPRKRIPIGSNKAQTWIYFDWGPTDYPEPLVFIHSTAGSADVFYNQMLDLGKRGYRVVSVEIASYYHVEEFIDAFQLFLDMLNLRVIHMYGAGLGGYLALVYSAHRPEAVKSLVLTHSYANTSKVFTPLRQGPNTLRWMPDFVIRKATQSLLPTGRAELHVAMAVEFILARIEETEHTKLAGRLALMRSSESVKSLKLPDSRITIIDAVNWGNAKGEEASNDLVEMFPRARIAYVKTQGEFIYLSDPDEVNVHLVVHMRRNAPEPSEAQRLPLPARARVKDPIEARKLRELAKEDHLEPEYKYIEEVQSLKTAFPNADVPMLASALSAFNGDLDVVSRLIYDGSIKQSWKGPIAPYIINKLKPRDGAAPARVRLSPAIIEEEHPKHSHDYIARGPISHQAREHRESPSRERQNEKAEPAFPVPAKPARFPSGVDDDEENPLLLVAEKALVAGPETTQGHEPQGLVGILTAEEANSKSPTLKITNEDNQLPQNKSTEDVNPAHITSMSSQRKSPSKSTEKDEDDPWKRYRNVR